MLSVQRHIQADLSSSLMKANTEADPPSFDVRAGSKCAVLAGLQHTLSLAPDKTVKHADRFPILSVCQASFQYM